MPLSRQAEWGGEYILTFVLLPSQGAWHLVGAQQKAFWIKLDCGEGRRTWNESGKWIQDKLPVWWNLSREVVWQAASQHSWRSRGTSQSPWRTGVPRAIMSSGAPPSASDTFSYSLFHLLPLGEGEIALFSYLLLIGLFSFCEVEEA